MNVIHITLLVGINSFSLYPLQPNLFEKGYLKKNVDRLVVPVYWSVINKSEKKNVLCYNI